MSYQLGIDLGTTFTAAAVCRTSGGRSGEPEVVTLGTRNATIPSVLFLGADGTVLVGEAAERRAVTDPDRVVREFKRRIGDPTPVVVGGRPWPAQELSARLVRWVVDRVAEREGGPATRIALTHPAAWGQHKKDLLGAALAGQGLTVTFLPEPSAAAVSYAANQRVEPDSTIAVYDLGGGTFDAAVVRKTAGGAGFDLLGRPEGIERLGGIDFDQVVFDHVREGLPGAFDSLDDADPEVLSAVSRVRRECTDAKEALSADTETNIPVLLPGTRGSVRMHRSEFEARIGGQIEETVSALRRAVSSAGLAPEALTAVLLVGGSSRIPLVSQMVSDQLGRPVAVDADPKNAIAKGAALAVSPQPAAPAAGRPVAGAGRPGGFAGAAGAAGAGAGPAGAAGAAGRARSGGPGGAAGAAAAGLAGAGAAGLAGAGAAGLAGAGAPPPRPRHQPLAGGGAGTPPGGFAPGGGALGGTQSGPYGIQPGGAPHGAGTQPYRAGTPSGGVEPVPRRAAQRPEPVYAEDDWDYEDDEPRRRTPAGLYVGIGALVAALVVVLAMLAFGGGGGNEVPTSEVPAATDVPPPATSTRPPATRDPAPTSSSPPPTSTPPPTSSAPPEPEPEPSVTSPPPEPDPEPDPTIAPTDIVAP
ncbi:MAG: Hsp70 family protein [Pseudonocardia sp.]